MLLTYLRQQSRSKTLKVYPRLQLHISFNDLVRSLSSFFYFSQREQHTREIQLFWKGDKDVLITLCVRTSLDLLLQSLNLPAGSEVLMSAINIRDMVEVVKQHGLVPVPIDIALDTLAPSLQLLETLISEKSRVFIVAHLFGSIINLEPYAQLCQRHNILLVEDCAQAFAGLNYYGSKNADVSFFSFGPIKSCTALGGAVTLISNRILAEKMENLEQKYPCKSEFWFFKRVLKYFGLKLFSIPWIYCHLLTFIKFLNQDVDSVINSLTRGFSKGDILAKIRYRPPARMLTLLNRRLRNCHTHWFERWLEERESKARKFLSLLLPEIISPGQKAEWNSFWVVPILVSNPELLMTELRENGFDATRGNTSLTVVDCSYSASQITASCPFNAEHLINHVLYLPVSESLPEKELVRLAEIVNEFYKKCPNSD